MPESIAHANGIELAYETFGDAEAPAMLLVMGLGSQMIHWDEEFCELLAARGFHVIRYDNRDVGHSSRIDARIGLAEALAGSGEAPYAIADMAGDAVGLLDAIGSSAAHVVGVSMGGMIAQQIAIDHPDRVLSLCSIMSAPGDGRSGMPRPEAAQVLVETRPNEREAVAEHHVRIFQAIGSPGFPPDLEQLRERGRLAFDRGISPDGFVRQLAAIIGAPDRTEALGAVRVPTLVIHGRADPLVDVSGGEATARAVPDARLMLFDGMGHDLPRELWEEIVEAIAANAAAARSMA
jgi:pimeloyl-ACP methyl ester carboxylesterase